ncbi:MAG: tRNA (adenosine(37)-N6)-threonylcarbamoyltransferase complex transferase subunit TsaD, partial [Spirochaeta sp.]
MLILGIESSCDECAVALVRDGQVIIANQIATQIEFHKPYAGVVPEIASRKHTEWILPVFTAAVQEAGIQPEEINGIA